jgi:RimJ/RimL family protein N-acetyltransferase
VGALKDSRVRADGFGVAAITDTLFRVGPLRTPRLLLPVWSDDDFDHFAAWTRDREATRWVLRRPLTDAELQRHHKRTWRNWRTLGIGKRAVLDAESGDWLGFVDICPVGPGKGCRAGDIEIEFFLLPHAWGRGIATEAAAAARDDAFDRAGVLELLGRYRVENTPSGRVLQKLGFTSVRTHRFPDGAVVEVTRLTRDEWEVETGRVERRPSIGGLAELDEEPTDSPWL